MGAPPYCERALHVAIDVVGAVWELAITDGPGRPIRWKAVPAHDISALAKALVVARAELDLPDDRPLYTCCQRTHDGIVLDRMLRCWGVESRLVTGDLGDSGGPGDVAARMLSVLVDHQVRSEALAQKRDVETLPLRSMRRGISTVPRRF